MTDLIHRDMLFEAMNKYHKKAMAGFDWVRFNEVMQSIVDLPLAEPEPRWIPVTERLPEVNGRYLVTRGLNACGVMWNRAYIINYSDLMGLKSERIWWNGNVGKSDFEHVDDVTAWMPLPKPYERSEE